MGDYLPYGILAYGYFPVDGPAQLPPSKPPWLQGLVLKWNTLTDRKGGVYGGLRQRHQRAVHLVPVYLADRKEGIEGFSFLTLYFTCEDGKTCERIVREYAFGNGPEGIRPGPLPTATCCKGVLMELLVKAVPRGPAAQPGHRKGSAGYDPGACLPGAHDHRAGEDAQPTGTPWSCLLGWRVLSLAAAAWG